MEEIFDKSRFMMVTNINNTVKILNFCSTFLDLPYQTYKTICVSQHNISTLQIFPIEQVFATIQVLI